MKVLFLARYLPQEGSTTHMYTLAKGLIDRGHDVSMISAGPKKEAGAIRIFEDITEYGMNHYKVKFPLDRSFSKVGKVIQLIKYMLTTPKVLYTIFKIKPDVIHVHYPVTSYIAKIYTTLTKTKFITTHHTTGIPMHPLHKKADYVIAISRELEEELKTTFKYRDDQVRLIFNGVSRGRFDLEINSNDKYIYKKRLSLPENKLIIGFVGKLGFGKGIDILFRACSEIESDEYHIVLAGDGDIDWVKSLVKEYKLEDNITIYPFMDPVELYKAFDIFILPSRKEGFPLVPLEAMMMGVPTIRSNVEGAYDQIDHGTSGYIFSNEDSNELKKYIEILVKDKELRSSMGKKGKLKSINMFSEDIMIDNLLKLYEESI